MGSQVKRLRQVQVGKLMLTGGMSFGAALRKVGYSKSVSRKPKSHGWDAEGCVRKAWEQDPGISGADLKTSVRRVFSEKINQLLEDAELLEKTSSSEIAKLLETAERYLGGQESPPPALSGGLPRMLRLFEVFEAYKRSGGDVAALGKGLRQVRSLESTGGGTDEGTDST